MNTSGFYKLIEEESEDFIKNGTGEKVNVMFAPNFVTAPNYELLIGLKDSYVYPIDGWYWFDTIDEMCQEFGVTKPVEEQIVN